MRKFYIGLLSLFFTVVSHAENAVEASLSTLPPTPFILDQPVRTFALVVGLVCLAITFHQALFNQKPDEMAKVKVLKD